MSLANKIKELRSRKGMSQELLAEESKLSLRTIQRIENNETIPRGDSLKKLAIALGTSPDEIVDWKIQEDKSFLIFMSISSLGFLFFPLLGIIIPLTMWVLKKDKLKGANKLGKAILNFQITWTIVLFLYYILFFTGTLQLMIKNLQVDLNKIYLLFVPLILLYAYNITITIYNSTRLSKDKTLFYRPAIPFLK